MTELQFLLDLLLNHKLTASTKKIVAQRIGDVEATFTFAPRPIYLPPPSAQAPSTQKLLDQIAADAAPIEIPPPTTPAAAQALQARSAAINRAANSDPFRGKPEPGRTSPRKF